MTLPPVSGAQSNAPPPAYSAEHGAGAATYALYQAHQPAPSPSVHAITHIFLLDVRLQRWIFTVRIPKKREGWKADVISLSDKGREEPCYEVRREPLARKYDFRPPNGDHNVMVPSSFGSGPKTFSIEAPDGQKLAWRKVGGRSVLLSYPSNALIAQYDVVDSHAPPFSSVPLTASVNALPARLQGMLQIAALEEYQSSQSRSNGMHRSISRASVQSSTSSSSSEAKGPRLYGAHKNMALGLFAPSVMGAAFGSPFAAAAMNRHCVLRDDLANLGRVTISAQQAGLADEADPSLDEDLSIRAATAEHWASLNRISSVRRTNDPRPRRVELDLVIASLIAVLTS